MVTYEFKLELSVVPGNVGIWVGVGTHKAVYVKCQPPALGRVKAELLKAYGLLSAQGITPTPEQLRALIKRPAPTPLFAFHPLCLS